MSEPHSLLRTILYRIIPATLIALSAVWLVTQYHLQKTIRNEVDQRITEKAQLTSTLLSDRIKLLRSSVDVLAKNDFIVNSIADGRQHDQPMNEFFGSLRMPSASFRRATLVDRDGKLVASTQAELPVEPERFIETTMRSKALVDIGSDRILIASPIRANETIAAAIAVEYETESFLDEFQVTKASGRFRFLRHDSVIYDSLSDHFESMETDQWIAIKDPLPGFPHLAAELSESEKIAFSSLRSANVFLGGGIIASLLALFLAILSAARIATQPLNQLINEVSEIREEEDLTRRVKSGGSLEFHQLSESFNEMLRSLSETTVSNAELQESESRLRTFIESVPNGIIVTDASGHITLVNAPIENMFGYSRAEVIGQTVEMFMPNALRDQHRVDRQNYAKAPHHRAMADQKSLFGIHKTGKKVPLEIGLSPVVLADGPGVLACVVDVTERSIQESQNEKMRRETQLILDSIPAMVIYKDDQNRILRVNQAASEMMGAPPQEIEGRHASDFFVEHEKYFLDDQAVMKLGKPRLSIVEEIVMPSGEVRWANRDKIPVFNDHGEAIGVIAVVDDITDLKQAKESLEASNEELKRSNEELAQFAYVASHDLQEPLRKVTSYCTLIQEDYKDILDDNGRTYLNYVVDGAGRMRTLIQDLLSYSKLDSARDENESVDLNKTVNLALENLAESVSESEAQITMDSLPMVIANERQCIQLFQNLIGNSLKYRSASAPVIHIAAEERSGNWVVSVADNGIGIEPQYFDQIFGVFKRLHSMDAYAGTGIGLAICKRIVERLNGRIWVESTPGNGSTFFVEFPKPS
ncbi:Phytochrome-like protein cph1 [Rubripirellula obstinata]|uniref:histidine kinase n=1 Tax=Rubripirellula obstinata TaxID=406547 RepID=A0A5B1CRU3_9BACT|nr:PAS domain S-box protein [Rubripirellula obstinata]KAA1262103.1 Phytochrome-like protein cph1 [Rubripirellula obstinata]